MNKTLFILLGILLPLKGLSAQDCQTKVSGFVRDELTGVPIAFANIYILENKLGTVSDSNGYFEMNSCCTGHKHFVVSHVGCEPRDLHMDIGGDTSLVILMDHSQQLLNDITVRGTIKKNTTQELKSISAKTINQSISQNLGNMLENISGVTTMRSGNNVSKPVVHGLYGNRLIVVNNGITQKGQQWGNDHSPEIDPLVANIITVIKGTSALQYQGNSLGAAVLVKPSEIGTEPHLHGKASYFFQSNGLGNGTNIQLKNYNSILPWKVTGTLKKSGDQHTPDYYLRNTGSEEANIAVQLEKEIAEFWKSNLFFSSYNANNGILRGSHIGNLNDLKQAFERDVPFYTEKEFSYRIDAPSQQVNHQLLKWGNQLQLSDKHQLKANMALQWDVRKEFDTRRGGRSDKPALSLKQNSAFGELKHNFEMRNHWNLHSGVQFNHTRNINIPETGTLPLIPDYYAYETGAFSILNKSFRKTKVEFGARYDYTDRRVAAITYTYPQKVVRYYNHFHNLTLGGGIKTEPFENHSLSYNLGYAARNPEVNELYSYGLHQGAAGIEMGDPDLKQEMALKNTLSFTGHPSPRVSYEALGYYQAINDYIFLNPQDSFVTTIQGTFPLFKYEQTDANIWGIDLSASYQLFTHFNILAKYSFIRGWNKKDAEPLINMPSNNLYAELNYHLHEFWIFEVLELQVNNRYVFEQKHLNANQDYVAPPPSYNLLGLKVSTENQFAHTRLNSYFRMENILNTRYRDYLNRMRYFADDTGFNLVLGATLSF